MNIFPTVAHPHEPPSVSAGPYSRSHLARKISFRRKSSAAQWGARLMRPEGAGERKMRAKMEGLP